MTRTPTLPPDDKQMWRRAKARAHPDVGGDHDLFIWLGNVEDLVCAGAFGRRRESEPKPRQHRPPPTEEPDRVPFDQFADFGSLTDRAVAMADAVAEPYGFLLRQVADCYPVQDGPLHDQQCRGTTYRALAAIGHKVGMSKPERVHWYRIAESVPLSQRHSGHILSKLEERAA